MKIFSSTTKGSYQSNLRNRRIKLILAGSVVAVLVWYLLPRLIVGVLALLMLPVSGIGNWLAQSPAVFPMYLRDRGELVQQLNDLQAEIASKEADDIRLFYVESELQAVRELVGGQGAPLLLGTVIASPPYTPYDSIVLDIGTDNGVQVGAPIYVGLDIVVGVISAAYDNSSVVTLFSSPGISTNAYIIGPNVFAVSRGQGGGVMQLGVPQGIALAVGDVVVLPAFGSGVFGTVSAVTSIASEPEQQAYVTIPTSVAQMRYVRVGATPVAVPDEATLAAAVAAAKEQLIPYVVTIEESTSTSTSTASTSSTL